MPRALRWSLEGGRFLLSEEFLYLTRMLVWCRVSLCEKRRVQKAHRAAGTPHADCFAWFKV